MARIGRPSAAPEYSAHNALLSPRTCAGLDPEREFNDGCPSAHLGCHRTRQPLSFTYDALRAEGSPRNAFASPIGALVATAISVRISRATRRVEAWRQLSKLQTWRAVWSAAALPDRAPPRSSCKLRSPTPDPRTLQWSNARRCTLSRFPMCPAPALAGSKGPPRNAQKRLCIRRSLASTTAGPTGGPTRCVRAAASTAHRLVFALSFKIRPRRRLRGPNQSGVRPLRTCPLGQDLRPAPGSAWENQRLAWAPVG